MKNTLIFAFLVFALTGLLTPSLMSDSFAGTENPGRDQGTKTANGCEKGTAKNNPNCENGGTEPPTGQLTACDLDANGSITNIELDDYQTAQGHSKALSFYTGMISDVETSVTASDNNGEVNLDEELKKLNNLLQRAKLVQCA